MKTIDKKQQVQFREKAKKQIDEIFYELDRLREKKAKVESESKQEYEKRIKELEGKKTELQSNYEDLKDTTEEKWEDAKNAWESSKEDFKSGFTKLKSIVE